VQERRVLTGVVDGSEAPAGRPPAIVLISPKYAHNVGMVVRLASCYGLKQVWFTGERVSLDICDDGAGMDADFVRERLFKPFDTTKGAAGMGIGAYQVREYARSLGGAVEVQSTPGSGTRFAIILPTVKVDASHV